jgi:transcriptional antiterminator Rof (Rho-off)
MQNYNPINCSFYDQLENAIVIKEKVSLEYLNENQSLEKYDGILLDIYSKEKAEFVKLADGTSIRLDFIQKLNGIENIGSCKI